MHVLAPGNPRFRTPKVGTDGVENWLVSGSVWGVVSGGPDPGTVWSRCGRSVTFSRNVTLGAKKCHFFALSPWGGTSSRALDFQTEGPVWGPGGPRYALAGIRCRYLKSIFIYTNPCPEGGFRPPFWTLWRFRPARKRGRKRGRFRGGFGVVSGVVSGSETGSEPSSKRGRNRGRFRGGFDPSGRGFGGGPEGSGGGRNGVRSGSGSVPSRHPQTLGVQHATRSRSIASTQRALRARRRGRQPQPQSALVPS